MSDIEKAEAAEISLQAALAHLRFELAIDALQTIELAQYIGSNDVIVEIVVDESTLAPKDCPNCKGEGFTVISDYNVCFDEEPEPIYERCFVCGGDLPNVPKDITEWVKFND